MCPEFRRNKSRTLKPAKSGPPIFMAESKTFAKKGVGFLCLWGAMIDNKTYKCPNCDQGLIKKEKFVYKCPDCQKSFEIKQGKLFPFSYDEESDIDDEDKEEIKNMDDGPLLLSFCSNYLR